MFAMQDEATAWKQALREGAVTGSLASILSTAVLALAGARQNRSAAAPINAASHWIWGDESLREDRLTLRHTLLGLLTQHAASIFWAALYSRIYGHRPEAKQWPQALAGAATTCAIAGVVDYMVVPKRLTPGYEHRLSTSAMVAVYAALAAGFALGAAVLRRR
jgi:formate-dependent nitrite reductase membrane component NrfD